MNYWKDKEKMFLIMIMVIALAFVLGLFVGRISAQSMHYLG